MLLSLGQSAEISPKNKFSEKLFYGTIIAYLYINLKLEKLVTSMLVYSLTISSIMKI
jgi:hypothetical protein